VRLISGITDLNKLILTETDIKFAAILYILFTCRLWKSSWYCLCNPCVP